MENNLLGKGMNRQTHRESGRGALELIEEAVHLLRRAPTSLFLTYYAGAFPLVFGLLYFLADMSRGALAYKNAAASAFVMALLFLWLKTCQARFCAGIRSIILGRLETTSPWREWARTALFQTIVQPSGLFLLPLALLVTVPFGWTFSIYQSLSTISGETDGGLRAGLRKAARLGGLWQKQNHLLIGILFVFGLFVFLNLTVGLLQLPFLLKTFLGIETSFTRSGLVAVLNTTFLTTVICITFLCVDPIVKATYALRCFYGESLVTGEDLIVDLRDAGRVGPLLGNALLILLCILPHTLRAQERDKPSATARPTAISSRELDQSIDGVIVQREYAWRLPRQPRSDSEADGKGRISRFMDEVWKFLVNRAKTVREWARKVGDLLINRVFPGPGSDRAAGGAEWIAALQMLLFILLVLVIATVVLFVWRLWKRQRKSKTPVVAQAMIVAPDLCDERVMANALPEDDWLKLATELMDKGDLRLALRALYLANLAHLARRELVKITHSKSNREYENELRRRTRGKPDLQVAFSQNVTVFDRVWYGMHETTRDLLESFRQNLRTIQTC